MKFAEGMCRGEADVLFCGYTAWHALEAVEELEARIGKPVVTSNQATVWAALRALGTDIPVKVYGRLLEALPRADEEVNSWDAIFEDDDDRPLPPVRPTGTDGNRPRPLRVQRVP